MVVFHPLQGNDTLRFLKKSHSNQFSVFQNLLVIFSLSANCQKNSNHSILFLPSLCVLQDQNSGKTIGTTTGINGLYYFDEIAFKNKKAQGLGSTSSTFVYDQVMLWHRRLGHPSFSYLKHLFPELFKGIDCSKFHCEACHLAKDHRVSFPLKPYFASKLFYLFHSDVWSPPNVLAKNGLQLLLMATQEYVGFICWKRNMKSNNGLKNFFL